MEKLLYYFKPTDDYNIEVHFPNEAWIVILKGIDHLKGIDRLKLLRPNFTNYSVSPSELDKLSTIIKEALNNKSNPILNRSGYEILDDSLSLTDRRLPSVSDKVLDQISFTPQEYDIKDQIDLYFWWNEDGSIASDPEWYSYEKFICIDRFDIETLNKRSTLFDLFGSFGFTNTIEGWSNRLCIPDDYLYFEEDFYWKSEIGFFNADVFMAEIGIIAKPTDMTFLPMVSFGCIVGCCGKPLRTFQASNSGINDMMMEIEEKAYQIKDR